MAMCYALAKTNLHLQVLNKREDGYHNLASIFLLSRLGSGLFDTLFINFTASTGFKLKYGNKKLSLQPTWPTKDDILYKTYYAYQQATQCQLGVKIDLYKSIPYGAGLGGGSSNAASLLLALNNETNILTSQELASLGKTLGADVPFFLSGYKAALVTGIGEKIVALEPRENLYTVVLKPDINISTKTAFTLLKSESLAGNINAQALKEEWDRGGFSFSNSFEQVLSTQYSFIEDYKSLLAWHGAIFTCLSGTGSAVVGYFNSDQHARSAFEQLKHQAPFVSLG